MSSLIASESSVKQVPSSRGEPSAPLLSSWRRGLATAFRISNVRLRFFLILLALFVIVGQWDTLWNYWETLSRRVFGSKPPEHAVSSDIEYWCPMCPGVVSDWPAKCPVCNMALVQRKKHEMVPLPDGVVSRMQLSPYRIQLAGIKTSTIMYQPLVQETTTGGYIEEDGHVSAEIFDRDVSFVREGLPVLASCESLPGHPPCPGRVQSVKSRLVGGRWRFQMRLTLEDRHRDFKPGMFVSVRIQSPPKQWDWYTRTMVENWCNDTVIDLLAHSLFDPASVPDGGLESLGRMIVQKIALQHSLVPAIPESAVVDTGRQKVVFVESRPGMFDGVEVVVGPRCGLFYPLIRGPELGERVVTVGAFLIDAEARLNPTAASLYFGSGASETVGVARPESSKGVSESLTTPLASRSGPATQASEEEKIRIALSKLDSGDRRLVEAQEFCPILEKNRLGSMGKPFKVMINEEPVFLCCEGCKEEAIAHAIETLAKVKQLKRRVRDAAEGK